MTERTFITDAGVDILELLEWAKGNKLIGELPSAKKKAKQLVHISRIRFDMENPRSVFLDLEQFATSLSREMLEPLEVAILPDGTVKLLEGHRRFIAMLYHFQKVRKLDANDKAACLPCTVVSECPSDAELLSKRLRKNDEREGFHPIDEALTLQTLMSNYQCDASGLAAKLGGKFTTRFIQSRMSLLSLATRAKDGIPALDYFLTGTITEQEALQVARLPITRQQEALNKICLEGMKPKELRLWVTSIVDVSQSIADVDQSPAATPTRATTARDASTSTPKKQTKKRAPQFAAAVKVPKAVIALCQNVMLVTFEQGSVQAKMRVNSDGRVLSVSLTPDNVELTPDLISRALQDVASQISAAD